jgi:hypothetical protein
MLPVRCRAGECAASLARRKRSIAVSSPRYAAILVGGWVSIWSGSPGKEIVTVALFARYRAGSIKCRSRSMPPPAPQVDMPPAPRVDSLPSAAVRYI